MSVTVATVYNMVCWDLLEDFGLNLGIVTQTEFLDMLGLVLMDFLQRTSIKQVVYTQQITSGTSVYSIPEANPELFSVFYNANLLDYSGVFAPGDVFFSVTQGATPVSWHQDQLPIQKVEIRPIPNFTGAAGAGAYGTFEVGSRNVSVVVSTLASKETWGAGDTLDTIPDTFTPYLVFGILEKIFSMDGESKDQQRALYCRSRYEEGIAVACSIVKQYISEAQE